MPSTANAGFFSFLFPQDTTKGSQVVTTDTFNSQNIPLLQSSVNFDLFAAKGGSDLIVSNNNEALVSSNGPSGTAADMSDIGNTGQITKYTIRKGDTLEAVAKMFGVSKNTILWANNIDSTSLKEGQVLVILPVSGTVHTVVKGDTLKSIAKRYKADANEIAQFNDISKNDILAVGDSIIIPDGEGATNISSVSSSRLRNSFKGGDGPDIGGYYIRPIYGGVRTQGLHGWNAVDLGTPIGTDIMAAAAGEIIVARTSGWNGGYGRYVVISHYNGTQTVYVHMSQVYVTPGQLVLQGQVIGLSGNTGNSTGPHLHFEVRGAKNPLAQ